MPERILIVGAGLSGLALAFRLQQRMPNAEVQVLESDSRPGGTAWTVERDGLTYELGPNGFLDSKPTTLELARELGLEKRLVPGSETAGKNRYLFLGDKLERLPGSPGDLLKTPLLSWRGKLSFLAERFRRKGTLADESIDAFARRRAGRETADIFADALVTGIYAGDPALLSLPACFPRIAALERDYGSILKGISASAKQRAAAARARGEPKPKPGRIWSFDGGLRVLVEALTASLRVPPILGVRIRSLTKTGDPHKPTWTVHGEGRDSWSADAIVLTCPAHQQAPIVRDLDPTLAEEVANIAFNEIAVVVLAFRAGDIPGGVDGFGFITPERLRRDILGVQWCSSIFPGRAPQGVVLMRAMCGGWRRADMVSWDDARLLAAVRAELKLVQNIAAEPVFHIIQRWRPGIPQYRLGHLARLERIDARTIAHPGLYLAGNSYRGVAMNDCTEQAILLADRISVSLSRQAR
jgi:oxygen-dependent protoporphyrinogen oxidase